MHTNSKNDWFWTSEYLAELKYQEGQQLNKRNTNHSWNWVLGLEAHHLTTYGRCEFSSGLVFLSLKVPIFLSCMSPGQNCEVFIKINILQGTQCSCEIRETCEHKQQGEVKFSCAPLHLHHMNISRRKWILALRIAHWWVHSGRKFAALCCGLVEEASVDKQEVSGLCSWVLIPQKTSLRSFQFKPRNKQLLSGSVDYKQEGEDDLSRLFLKRQDLWVFTDWKRRMRVLIGF